MTQEWVVYGGMRHAEPQREMFSRSYVPNFESPSMGQWAQVWDFMYRTGTPQVHPDAPSQVRQRKGVTQLVAEKCLQHKTSEQPGAYVLHSPGHWRIMLTFPKRKHVLLFDPMGACFRGPERAEIQRAYNGHADESAGRRIQLWGVGNLDGDTMGESSAG